MIEGPDPPELLEAAQRLEHDIREAVELRYMLYLRELDKSYTAGWKKVTKKGVKRTIRGRIIYALDSNLLYEYFSVSRAKRSPNQKRPARLFAGPVSNSIEAGPESDFGAVIKQYVLSRLSPDVPLLLLPGHSSEAKSVFDSVTRGFDAHGDRGRSAREQVAAYLQALASAKDAEERLIVAQKWTHRIKQLLYSLSDPHDKFVEFNRLLARRRLLGIQAAAKQPEFNGLTGPDKISHAFLSFEGASSEWEGSIDWWDGKLNPFLPRRFLEQDKLALSALDRINRLLRPHNTKVVLLTTNPGIIEAGKKYRPYKYEADDIRDLSFTDLYLRDPKFLLAEPDLILDADNEAEPGQVNLSPSPADWLDTFLAHCAGNSHQDAVSFRKAVKEKQGSDGGFAALALKLATERPKLHLELIATWAKFLEQANLSHGSSSSMAVDRIVERFRSLEAPEEKLLKELDDHIRQRTEDSWNEFFLMAVESGYQLVDLSGDVFGPSRIVVPPIILQNQGNDLNYARLLSQDDGIIRNKETVLKFLEGLSSSTAGDDPTGYVRALCYALLFAHADRWPVATLVALRAAKIARTILRRSVASGADSTQPLVTGREAYFLAAVGTRLTATQARDLDAARANIRRAVEAMDQEKQTTARAEGDYKYPLTGLRFEAERIACDVAELCFIHIPSAASLGRGTKEEIALITRCRQLQVEVLRQLADSERCGDVDIRAATCLSLRTEYFSLLMLQEMTGPLPAEDLRRVPALVVDQVGDYRSLNPSANGKISLSVTDTYLLAYAASLAANPDWYLPGLSRRLQLLSRLDEDRDRLVLMPYDKRRFQLILKLVAAHDQDRPSKANP